MQFVQPSINHAHCDLSAIAQMGWHRGEPEPAKFIGLTSGIKVDKTEFVPITAFRCSGCGVLRFYAHVPDAE